MKIGKTLSLVLVASMLLSIAMMSPVAANGTTIGVEPAVIAGDLTFTVEIWIRDVVGLAGVEFKLGYDTAVLTATEIEYGGIFGMTYFPIMSAINDGEGWLGFACMEMFGEPSFDGDGRVAIITFIVDVPGECALDLYDTKLGESSHPSKPIPHTAIDGYGYFTVPQVSLHAKVINVKDRKMVVCETQHIKGLISNKGAEGAYVRVQFVILDAGHTVAGVATSGVSMLGAGADMWATADWHAELPGSFHVKGIIEFSADGINFVDYGLYTGTLGGLESFRVVGPSWFKVA